MALALKKAPGVRRRLRRMIQVLCFLTLKMVGNLPILSNSTTIVRQRIVMQSEKLTRSMHLLVLLHQKYLPTLNLAWN